MNRAERIQKSLSAMEPSHLEILDESHKHRGREGQESHFRIRMVSDKFEGVGRAERHRRVHALLQSELDSGLHAVTLQLLTEAEAEKLGLNLESPKCVGAREE